MANPYPAAFIDQNNEGRIVGEINFTDSGNQPGGGSSFLTAEVALTNAEIKAFGTSSNVVDVVAAPGLGQFVLLHRGLVIVDAVAGVYTNVGNTAATFFGFKYNGGSAASVSVTNAAGAITEFLGGDGEISILAFTPSAQANVSNFQQGQVYDASEVENLPLCVYGPNAAAGPYTGGNAANSGRAKVWYTIETLA